MAVNIIDVGLKFKTKFVDRSTTRRIIMHHTGTVERQTVQIINAYYQSRTDANFNGIAYHYYISQEGKIYLGRPENAVGAHCSNHNDDSIGVCFEGNFDIEYMATPQLNAGIAILTDILARHGKLSMQMHKDFVNTTSPGKNFPYDKLVVNALNPAGSVGIAAVEPEFIETYTQPTVVPDADLHPLVIDIIEVYTVKSGDTFASIAGCYGITTQELLAANKHISNTYLIIGGQNINIPAPSYLVGDNVFVNGTAKNSSSGMGSSVVLRGQKMFITQYLKLQSFPYGVARTACSNTEYYMRADALSSV